MPPEPCHPHSGRGVSFHMKVSTSVATVPVVGIAKGV
jgi:hypothetical protein